MKFYAVTSKLKDTDLILSDYKTAHEIGVLRVGKICLYIKRGRKQLYIPYKDICCCFRRVQLISSRLCCGKGDIPIENLVVCDKTGEIAQIQLPGTKAAKILMAELKEHIPDIDFTVPKKITGGNIMTLSEALNKVLASFKHYYNINIDNPVKPFVAEAEFRTHDEMFFLIKSAKLFESMSCEHVFFATEEYIDKERFLELDKIAWTEGLSRVIPQEGHKSTDVTLVILANNISLEAFSAIKKQRHYKSYMFGLHGWSNYRLIALELSSGHIVNNRQAQNLNKLFNNIFK